LISTAVWLTWAVVGVVATGGTTTFPGWLDPPLQATSAPRAAGAPRYFKVKRMRDFMGFPLKVVGATPPRRERQGVEGSVPSFSHELLEVMAQA
jgi:hypothetical protein